AQDLHLDAPGQVMVRDYTLWYRNNVLADNYLTVRFYQNDPLNTVPPPAAGLIAEYANIGPLDYTPLAGGRLILEPDPPLALPPDLWIEVESNSDQVSVPLTATGPSVGTCSGEVYDVTGEFYIPALSEFHILHEIHGVACFEDCNVNDIHDACDIDCGVAGGPCDVPGCGDSEDCNASSVPDECDVAEGTSVDVNGNDVPDECEIYEYAFDDDLDNGETVVLNPGEGSSDPTEEAHVEITNVGGPDNAQVGVSEYAYELHPGAGGYGVFDTTLAIQTTLEDGQFFMTVMIPFEQADLEGADPLSVDLTHYDPSADAWVLAALENTVNSPGHDGTVGDRFAVEGTILPLLSVDLGDYGVFWNTSTLHGFVWANVDHTTDFAAGLELCVCGDINGSGGLVDLNDFASFALCFGVSQPGPNCGAQTFACSDLDGNGQVDLNDFSTFALWFGLQSSHTVPDCGP
ncbi:MAG: hypothetical protein JSU68_04440, partial [Phycisphaerales bacterium]